MRRTRIKKTDTPETMRAKLEGLPKTNKRWGQRDEAIQKNLLDLLDIAEKFARKAKE